MFAIRCVESGLAWGEFDTELKIKEELQKYGEVRQRSNTMYSIADPNGQDLMLVEIVQTYKLLPMSEFPLPVVVGVDV